MSDSKSTKASPHRLRREVIPAAPASQIEFEIIPEWFLWNSDESMLKANNTSGETRILIFPSKDLLIQLSRSAEISANGKLHITF